jgi:hypothetical protein
MLVTPTTDVGAGKFATQITEIMVVGYRVFGLQ